MIAAQKKQVSPEPTLYDVMDMLVSMHQRMDSIETQFEVRFDSGDSRLTGLDKGQQMLLENMYSVQGQLHTLEHKVSGMNVRLAKVENTAEDMSDTLTSFVFEVRGQERRIRKLEKDRA